MAGVTLANVSKRFGDVSVIEGLSLEIRDEEFMVLVGPSGCGKSTALRMIAGLEDASAGTVSIGGRVVNELPPKDRDIAMVFQSYALYPHMTVRENLEFGLRIRKLPRAEIDRLVQEAAGMLGLERLLERKPRQLSGGQRQRVALGRALVRKPAVFLFDEPLSNLDAKLRVQMRAEITKLQQRLRTTSVYVTHDQTEAMTMGQRIAVMKDGRLQQVGTPLEVYEKPANLFVARFIGTPPMNLVRATVAAGGDRLDGDGFSLPAPSRLRPLLSEHAGSVLMAGLRPESLSGPAARGRAGTAPLVGTVEILEPLGHEVVVHVRVGAELWVARLGPREAPAVGSPLALQADLEGLHLFDLETEARLGD